MTPSRLFGDRYQVGDTLGFGGMSEVHRGRDLRLGRDVAIKVLRADLARDPSFQTRFRREAQNAASLNHPAIVAVYDTGETQGETGPIPYIVMEYVDGQTLRDILKREGALPAKRAMEIMADVCAALDFSHRHGIVHRDVKPANIMLTKVGAVKVMDFGIARAIADGQATMTATAAVIGTAQYLSPEQARGEAVDARSDVYAAGCVLYELLTNTPPFTGDSPVAIAYQHVREDAKPPSETNPNVPKELDSIVLKALNKNPLNRYQTAAEMRSDMVRALSGQAVHATPVMSDDERTELLRATPARMPAAAQRPSQAPLLAPPSRIVPQSEWEEEPPSKSKRVWTFVGIGALCLAVLAAAIWITINLTTQAPTVPKAQVPDVTNLAQGEATARLNEMGFEVANPSKFAESDQDKKDKVIDQSPSANTYVDSGSVITLTIGSGKSQVQVPDLVGDQKDAAVDQLTKVSFVPKVKETVSSASDSGRVISQNPKAGAMAPYGGEVTVTVGTGPELTTMPSELVGLQLEEAKKALVAAKLEPIVKAQTSAEPKDQVLQVQGPDAGASVPVGTAVILVYSDFSQMTMPFIQNANPQGAFEALKAAGWGGGGPEALQQTTEETWDTGLIGNVIKQDPAPNTVMSKSDVVSIVIGITPQWTPDNYVGRQLSQVIDDVNTKTQGRSQVIVDKENPGTKEQDGTVSGQSLPSSTRVDVGTELHVQIYKYTPPVNTSTPPPSGSGTANPTNTAPATAGAGRPSGG